MPAGILGLLICAATAATLTACSRDSGSKDREAPPATETPTRPYTLPGLAHGLVQSPVNILSGDAKSAGHRIAVNFDHADPKYLENKGHTIELDFPEGSSVSFDGRNYELKQLHFHTPSEHQIDGITYPMEMHIVNLIEPNTEDSPPLYLVISFLYRMGAPDPFITSFLDEVPSEQGVEDVKPGAIVLSRDDREMEYEYYHYRGSLTTPPYTETVDWLVVKSIQQASPEQIRRINLLEGDNARRVQALYGRKVED